MRGNRCVTVNNASENKLTSYIARYGRFRYEWAKPLYSKDPRYLRMDDQEKLSFTRSLNMRLLKESGLDKYVIEAKLKKGHDKASKRKVSM